MSIIEDPRFAVRAPATSAVAVASLDVIPLPAEVVPMDGHLRFTRKTSVVIDVAARGGQNAARHLRRELGLSRLGTLARSTSKHNVRFRLAETDLGAEGYELNVTPAGVTIDASHGAGWLYGVQTLVQMLPVSATVCTNDDGSEPAAWDVPCVRIVDTPRFPYRGLMLDVVRHMLPVDGILRLLDTMSAHKLNVFHLHLTDDQGWRIESHLHPKLSEIGGYRAGSDGLLTPSRFAEEIPHVGKYGGFYTHADIRKIVAHAADLHIQVVPEIEMPGHAMAALAAYPELSCTGGPFQPASRMGVLKDVYCAGNDATFALLESVIDEILPLFPSQYVHVGGDECPKDRWRTCPKCQARIKAEGLADEHELQSYVVARMSKFLASRGKKLIGWDEILEGGLAPGATVMSWRGTEGGIAAARAGRDVVMSPHTHCYLDYAQATEGEPVGIPDGLTSLEKTYSFDPVPAALTAEQAEHILGVQGNLWTEYVADMEHAEYMIWPRAAAIAELGWSSPEGRDFANFRRRAQANEARLARRGVAYRPV